MMMMTIKKFYPVLFLILVPLTAYSQEKDFGIWYGVTAEHKLKGKFDIDLSTCIRTFNNAAKIEEAYLEGGLTYNFSKYLTAAGSYRITKNIENDNSYYFRHKVFIDFKGILPVRDFAFSCRIRFQRGIRTYIENEEDKYPFYVGRIKIKALYKTPTFPVNPYVYSESFCPMFSDKTRTIEKNRFAAGIAVSIIKRHSVEVEYIFQRDYLPHLSDLRIISFNYDFNF